MLPYNALPRYTMVAGMHNYRIIYAIIMQTRHKNDNIKRLFVSTPSHRARNQRKKLHVVVVHLRQRNLHSK